MGNIDIGRGQEQAVNQEQIFLPNKKDEAEMEQYSPPNSGQAEIGMINSRQADSGCSHQEVQEHPDINSCVSENADSVYAVVGEQLEMTMSMQSSKIPHANPVNKQIQNQEKVE